jgi:DNA segregation ATPase FtsK/SpoIIIE, S-DNA-T family
LLRSLVLRVALSLPHHVRFLLLDPAGLGENFRNVTRLPRVMTADSDPRRSLDEVIDHIRHINHTYLDGEVRTFHDLAEAQRLAEDFRFVVCADLPRGYDQRAIDALRTIAQTGPRAGVYLLAHEVEGTKDNGLPFTDRMAIVDLDAASTEMGGLPGSIRFDTEPPIALAQDLLQRLREVEPQDVPVSWRDLQPPREQWWGEDSTSRIEAPIGRSGVTDQIRAVFGVDQRGAAVVHGILAATSGGGKSTLFHNLIAGLAIRYPPEELRLYLIDGKYGTEFARYAGLPHAEVVSLNTDAEVARSLLAELIEEMERRNDRFRRAGCSDLREYREQTKQRVPRVLTIVDEYQHLFDGDDEDVASTALVKLSEQGRSAGIHLLLASQGFHAKGMRHRSDVMRNVHLRIAMMMSPEEVRQLSEFDAEGRRLIGVTCDQVGKLVLNDRSGADGSNVAGRAALLLDTDDEEVRDAIASRFPDTAPILLDGQQQTAVRDLLPFRASLSGVVDAAALQALSRRPVIDGGFGDREWLAADRPVLLPWGRALSVRGQVAATLRRTPDANVVLVGDDGPVRVGILAGMLGAVATLGPLCGGIEVRLVDLSRDGTAWHGLLPTVLHRLGFPDHWVADRSADAGRTIREVAAEVTRRLALDDREVGEAPSRLLILHDPDRIGALAMRHDDFGPEPSELARTLLAVLEQGPRVGVHVLISIAVMGSLRAILPERSIQAFRHRAGLQMAEDDAFALMTDPAPSRLRRHEPPTQGAYLDARRGVPERFVPTSLDVERPDAVAHLVDEILRAVGAPR